MVLFFIVKYVAFLLACISSFALHVSFSMPIVLSASVVGLVGTFIPFPKSYKNHPYAAIYAGSFAGMCSAELINDYWQLALLSLIGTSLYALTMNLFVGFGGRLGGVAFVSVALFVLTRGLL